jgi:peptidoglycan/LPS O-acetylase OafA/YrhL
MNSRIAAIDGWRVIAAMGVLYSHAWTLMNYPSLKIGPVDILQVMNLWGSGVHLFFVISGFCFYLVLSRQTDYTFGAALKFWSKRWLRLAPAFYVACIIYASANYAFFQQDFFYRLFFNFIFFQNEVPNTEIQAIYWSLAVEWHFYLLLPLIFRQLRRSGLTKTIAAILVIHTILNLLHYKGLLLPGDAWNYTIFANLGHFAWGILMGYLYAERKQFAFFSHPLSIIAGLGIAYAGKMLFYSHVVSALQGAGFIAETAGPLIMTLGFACMIYSTLNNKTLSKIFGARYIAALGTITYSFYLWHNFILLLVYNQVGGHIPKTALGLALLILMVLIILIPVSMVSYRLFESFYFKPRKLAVNASRT